MGEMKSYTAEIITIFLVHDHMQRIKSATTTSMWDFVAYLLPLNAGEFKFLLIICCLFKIFIDFIPVYSFSLKVSKGSRNIYIGIFLLLNISTPYAEIFRQFHITFPEFLSSYTVQIYLVVITSMSRGVFSVI